MLVWVTWLATVVVSTALLGLAPTLDRKSVAVANKTFVWATVGSIRAVINLGIDHLVNKTSDNHTERRQLWHAWQHRLRQQQG